MKDVTSLILDLTFHLSFYTHCVNGNGVVCNVNKPGTAVGDREGLDAHALHSFLRNATFTISIIASMIKKKKKPILLDIRDDCQMITQPLPTNSFSWAP